MRAEREEKFKIMVILPITKEILIKRLKETGLAIQNIGKEGIPWAHDDGAGIRQGRENLIREEREISKILKEATVIIPPTNPQEVALGVILRLAINNQEETFCLGSTIDVRYHPPVEGTNGWISDESLLGSAVLGKRSGDLFSYTDREGNIVSGRVLAVLPLTKINNE